MFWSVWVCLGSPTFSDSVPKGRHFQLCRQLAKSGEVMIRSRKVGLAGWLLLHVCVV